MDDKEKPEKNFSDELQEWLDSDQEKTISGLEEVFGEKSFAIAFILLMTISALPLPTGGVTHVFQVVTMLLALELIAQRRSIWLPKRWQKLKIPQKMQTKTLPSIIKMIRKVEKISRPRMAGFLETRISRTLFGVAVLGLAIAAFIAPPFSFLDTLPSIGILAISLGIIVGDIVIGIAGAIIGAVGVFLTVAFGTLIAHFMKDLIEKIF